jgi:hypothetical protein
MPHICSPSPQSREPVQEGAVQSCSLLSHGHWIDWPLERSFKLSQNRINGSPTQDSRLKVTPNPDERKRIKEMIQFKFTFEFRPPVPRISLTFYLAALQNTLCSEFASAQMLRDTNCRRGTGFIGVDPHQDSSIALHTFLDELVKCTWHETSSIWNGTKGELFFIRMGWHLHWMLRAGRAKSQEQNRIHSTQPTLGDPRIMSLQIDEKQVVGELCQRTNLNCRARHGGCLAQLGVRGRII